MKLNLNLSQTVTLTNLELLAIRFPSKKMRSAYCEPFIPLKGEVVKDVPGTNGECQVTSFGRFVCTTGGKKWIKKPASNGNGAKLYVDYMFDGKKTKEQLNRLVMRVFSPISEEEMKTKWVLHENCNVQDLRIDNMRWADRSETALHYRKNNPSHFRKPHRLKYITKTGKTGYRYIKYTVAQVADAKLMIEAGVSEKKIAELLKMTVSMINKIKRNTKRVNG